MLAASELKIICVKRWWRIKAKINAVCVYIMVKFQPELMASVEGSGKH